MRLEYNNSCEGSNTIFMRYFEKLIYNTLFIFTLAWISSCKKDITPPQNFDPTVGVVSLIKNEGEIKPGKYVFFQVLQNADAIDTSASFAINVFGKFTDDVSGAIVNAGNIVINNSLTVNGGPDNLYEYKFDQAALPMGKASLGNFINVQIRGSNAVDSLSRKLYIPKPIFLYNLYKSASTISNNKSYNLSWNPDEQNMFGKVLIQVDYHTGSSQTNNFENPGAVKGLVYTVSDNGSFVIPAADLQRFPVSSYISISISRATDNSWPTNRGHIEYIAVTSAFSSPILIQN